MNKTRNPFYKSEIKNEFSWSKSRDAVFRECLRKYFFTYYGSWGGWKLDAPQITRELYILKRLQNRFLWIGSTVHSCIERSLKNLSQGIRPLSVEMIIKITIDKMRTDFASSRRKLYRQNPKTCGLFEHEYNIEINNEEWKQITSRVETCLKNFYSSAIYQHLYKMPREYWLETEELSCFFLDGVKIFVVLDCSYKKGEEIFIADWKTGKIDERDTNIQLACYALYAKDKWSIDFRKLNVTAFNLTENIQYNLKLSSDLVNGMREYIRGSISDMKKLLSSVEKNKAVEKDFPKTTNRNLCQRCNFRKICFP